MILTLTPNPSLDLLFTADRLVWDDANRVPMPRRRPGGQGINVVRAIRALEPGAAARAIAPLGGAVGRELEAMLTVEGTPLTAVASPGETRVFVGVRERGGARTLLLNPRGPDVGRDVEERLMAAVMDALDHGRIAARDGPDDGPGEGPGDGPGEGPGEGGSRWLACCGSLLPGLGVDFYARAGAAARERGWSFVPDCDGEPLRVAVEAGADLLVPNIHEAERLLGRAIGDVPEAGDAARELLGMGPRMAVVTMGADGAVAATADGCWHACTIRTPALRAELEAGSAVGAGDAFLAALLLSQVRGDAAAAESLGQAVAAGAGTLLSRGDQLVRRSDVARAAPHVTVARL